MTDLEQYPLAKAYGWRPPKGDTGGILYLYPPMVSNRRYSAPAGGVINFQYIRREHFESLNPDDLHEIKLKKNGDPFTNHGRASNRVGRRNWRK